MTLPGAILSEETKRKNRIRSKMWRLKNPERYRASLKRWWNNLTKQEQEDYRKDYRDYYRRNREKILAKRKKHQELQRQESIREVESMIKEMEEK